MELEKGDKVTVKIANSPAFPGKIEVRPPDSAFLCNTNFSPSSAAEQ